MSDGVRLPRLPGEPSAVCVEGDKVTRRFTPACRRTPVTPVSGDMDTVLDPGPGLKD